MNVQDKTKVLKTEYDTMVDDEHNQSVCDLLLPQSIEVMCPEDQDDHQVWPAYIILRDEVATSESTEKEGITEEEEKERAKERRKAYELAKTIRIGSQNTSLEEEERETIQNGKLKEISNNIRDINGTECPQGERAKKKRKTMKDLKAFTRSARQEERKFKGWSGEGSKFLCETQEAIKKDIQSKRQETWERCYRTLCALKDEDDNTGQEEKKSQYKIDTDKMYEFD